MKTYIDRKALLKAIQKDPMPINLTMVMNHIHNAPSADVVPVVHGKLVSTGYDELYCEFGNCTVCGADNPTSNKYCGQCGAKMDGVEK